MINVKNVRVAVKKVPDVKTIVLTLSDSFCSSAVFNILRGELRSGKGVPSPKALKVTTPNATITIWREANAGFAAKWFCKDSRTNRTFEGTKLAVQTDASDRVALAARGL